MNERMLYWRLVELRNAILFRKHPDEIAFALAGFEAKRARDALAAGDAGLAQQLEANASKLHEAALERKAELEGWATEYVAARNHVRRGVREAAVGRHLGDDDRERRGRALCGPAMAALHDPDVYRREAHELARKHQAFEPERRARLSALGIVPPRAGAIRAPRRACAGRRRPGRRATRSSAASGDSGGESPAATQPHSTAHHRQLAPPWFLEAFGHLRPDRQLEVLHRLPEREREAFSMHIVVAAEARSEIAPGLRPVGLLAAEYVSSLRRRA
jgi:hypothetical protein